MTPLALMVTAETKEKVCIVDSSASMANHLETVCLADSGSLDLHDDLKGLPYLVCETDGEVKIEDGEVKSSADKKKESACRQHIH